MTTNTTDVQDREEGPRREPGKAMPSPGALWTGEWKLFQVPDPRASGLLATGGAGRLSSFGESQKVWKHTKFQGLSHSGSRWRGGGGCAPEAPQPPPFLKGPVVHCPAERDPHGSQT